MHFHKNYESAGLTIRDGGIYIYEDRFSKIVYRSLHTTSESPQLGGGFQVPRFAIFTKSNNENEEFKYVGTISALYSFVGNENTINQILDSILEANTEVVWEQVMQSSKLTEFYYKAILRNVVNIPQIGDVYPTISIRNSYNGKLVRTLTFGISLNDRENKISCNFEDTLGKIKQKHIKVNKSFSIGISNYINIFNENIESLIQNNMNNILPETTIEATLEKIEKIGMKRKDSILGELKNLNIFDNDGNIIRQPTSWELFLAILRYTNTEQNINSKVLLENIAERVLNMPVTMTKILNKN